METNDLEMNDLVGVAIDVIDIFIRHTGSSIGLRECK